MNTLRLSEKEIVILKIIVQNHGGTAQEIYRKGSSDSDFVAILRVIHTLHKKGLLLQIRSGSESIYKVSDKGLEVIK